MYLAGKANVLADALSRRPDLMEIEVPLAVECTYSVRGGCTGSKLL